jgi:hypothetical protein
LANATVSHLGEVNNDGGGDYVLFLSVFGQMVLSAFLTVNVMMPLHTVRTITQGHTARFPAIGTTTAAHHTPGAELVGDQILHAERTIAIDDALIASAFVANIDEAKNHYEVRADYARKLGHAISRKTDQRLLQTAVLAARASATVTGGSGGTALTAAGFATDGEVLADGIFDAAQTLDEKDVPDMGDRYLAVRPAQYNLLAQSTKILNRDWGGEGSYATGKVLRVSNIKVVKTNNLPITNIASGDSGTNNTYHGDFSTTKGVVWQPEAVGTVKLRDMNVEAQWDFRRRGTLMIAEVMQGHGILRPECAVELKTS